MPYWYAGTDSFRSMHPAAAKQIPNASHEHIRLHTMFDLPIFVPRGLEAIRLRIAQQKTIADSSIFSARYSPVNSGNPNSFLTRFASSNVM